MPYLNFWKVASYFWILPFLLFFSVFVGYAASSPLNELVLMEQIIQLVKETVLLIVLITLITLILSVPAAIVTGLFDFLAEVFFLGNFVPAISIPNLYLCLYFVELSSSRFQVFMIFSEEIFGSQFHNHINGIISLHISALQSSDSKSWSASIQNSTDIGA